MASLCILMRVCSCASMFEHKVKRQRFANWIRFRYPGPKLIYTRKRPQQTIAIWYLAHTCAYHSNLDLQR